ncbi:MAG TPA: hypothetical protein P5060_03620 [Candidatus Absconditabacterales bacterium]|nr:hypothetical protein [Candidatus Absconditabacterales bacterium]
MKTFFEILKGFFFFLTIVVALFFLRGEILLSNNIYTIIKTFIMPGYLIFCGLMIGYLIAHIWSKDQHSHKIYVKSFIIGIIIGIILSLSYMFI